MQAKTAPSLSIQLPADDGAIARAFADLTDKMTRLMSAISQAGTLLTRTDERPDLSKADERVEATATTKARNIETAIAAEQGCESAAAPLGQAEVVDATTASSATVSTSTKIFAEEPAPPSASPGEAVLKVSNEQARVAGNSQDLALAEDEALLASLDPETASVIRVKRRLTGGRKRVKELLEEYQASENAKSAEAPRKKSWWKGNR